MNRPDELFALDPATGTARQLTRFNEKLLAELDLGKVEEFWFDGAGGDKSPRLAHLSAGLRCE